ncbi:MAG: PH domain-containing protein [Gammaproteobacteria bacterium]|nr:MAG: PH domain-containing protein [Gammaproteobacteria bacterium]
MDNDVADSWKNSIQRWAPLAFAAGALVSLLLAMAIRGVTAMWFLALFAVLLPAAFSSALMRWWPRGADPGTEFDWRRNLILSGAGLLLAAVLTLLLGVAWTGGRLGNMLLVAGAMLLPPAALVAALGWLLGRRSHLDTEMPAGEHVLHRAKEHWGVLLPPAGVLLLAVLCLLIPLGVIGFSAAAVLYLLVLPGTGVAALAAFLNTSMVVTERHLLIEKGIFRRRVRKLALEKVDACGVKRGWLGRLLGYGRVSVICLDGSSLTVRGVADPQTLRQFVLAKASS